MNAIEEYVARTEGTCGKDKNIIVTFRYNKRDEAIKRILARAKVKKSLSQIIFELEFKSYLFRLYGSGKAIFRDVKDKSELNSVLTELLS
jgi:hypothetical protein